jgi:uncharacterized protein GlcG (DUF336 family)
MMKSIVVERSQISSEAAEYAVQASACFARSLNAAVSIAVVDTGGHLVAFVRTEGAPFHTRSIAEDKAATAVSFGISTKALGEALQSRSENSRSVLQLRPHLVSLGGGLPICIDGKVVGAIGVSGIAEEIDERIVDGKVVGAISVAGITEEIDERIAAEGLAAISGVPMPA